MLSSFWVPVASLPASLDILPVVVTARFPPLRMAGVGPGLKGAALVEVAGFGRTVPKKLDE